MADTNRDAGPVHLRALAAVKQLMKTHRRFIGGTTVWLLIPFATLSFLPLVDSWYFSPAWFVLVNVLWIFLSVGASWTIPLWILRARLTAPTGIFILVVSVAAFLYFLDRFAWGYLRFDIGSNNSLLAALYLLIFVQQMNRTKIRMAIARIEELRKPCSSKSSNTPVDLPYELRQRAHEYRRGTRLSMVAIFTSLVGGAALFAGADAIATMNRRLLSSIADDLEHIKRVQDDAKPKLDQLYSSCVVDTTVPRSGASDCYDVVLYLRTLLEEKSSSIGMDELIRKVGSVSADYTQGIESREVISSLSTRVGSVLMIIFLVQIMAGIYRYGARMAAFYDSRADILSVGEITREDLVKLLSSFSVDFDRFPRPPVSELNDVIKRTVDAALKGRA